MPSYIMHNSLNLCGCIRQTCSSQNPEFGNFAFLLRIKRPRNVLGCLQRGPSHFTMHVTFCSLQEVSNNKLRQFFLKNVRKFQNLSANANLQNVTVFLCSTEVLFLREMLTCFKYKRSCHHRAIRVQGRLT